ncbi:MAG TPA: diacylglycerol kinase family protein [Bacillus sp. (in: firmicutes)]|uniref:diacylglycerol kinase n=1 Tax=Bacillus litorisediminis TaxID=2922713 RepID=UPI001FAD4E51|nr:diacylglycerol kinase family protein [Bacillus litorisediminis]HWO77683.1 diacylglycerol kinase family protein [Bacillus sp. (in: firmicutes)]
MDSKDRAFRNRTFLSSFKAALSGIISASKHERNFQFHLVSAAIVTTLGFLFSITWIEWLFVCSAIFGVLILELINSSIERAVDLVTKEYHELAKAAKDMASGAVFLFAVYAVIVGIIVFIPKIWNILS